jgi:hypothetical protein
MMEAHMLYEKQRFKIIRKDEQSFYMEKELKG